MQRGGRLEKMKGMIDRKQTARQKAYQEYLRTPEWKRLSAAAQARDGKCMESGSVQRLQAQHWRYPTKIEDTTLEDLRTLWRRCHRAEHELVRKAEEYAGPESGLGEGDLTLKMWETYSRKSKKHEHLVSSIQPTA